MDTPTPSSRQVAKYILLAAIDESAAAAWVIEAARQQARAIPGIEIHLAHAIEPLAAPAVALGGAMITLPSSSELMKQGREYLERWAVALGGENHTVRTHLLVGDPGGEVLKLAGEVEADLLVVGTHDPGRIERLLFGSVAERLVRAAPCAVLVTRQKRPDVANVPAIEPVCPQCQEAREKSGGEQMWCARHSEHHPRAHTYGESAGSFGVGSSTFRPE